MQIAATNPISVDRDGIPPVILDNEREIYSTQAKEAGKPDKIIEKIVDGKMNKFYTEACLLEQAYVKNPDITVQDLLHDMMAKTGENIAIRRFARFQLGELDER
jgi:elongation factor Ts